MQSMVGLAVESLKEISSLTGICTTKDIETVLSRCEKEGLSFLTITLPQFEKDLLVSISTGVIPPNLFIGFSKRGGAPEFLGGLLGCLFNCGTFMVPVISEDWRYQAEIISHLRQFLLLFKKVEMACTPVRQEAAYNAYLKVDQEISEISEYDISRFADMSKFLFQSLFHDWGTKVFNDLEPSYSGGALATRETFNERFSSLTWTERLHDVFPYWDFMGANWRHLYDESSGIRVLSPAEEVPSRVTSVPKTMKTPRIIAMEPSWNNQIQQAILRCICDTLESDKFASLNSGFYWDTQDHNRFLAKVGSESTRLATIDLSEASDRVSLQLIRDGLLKHHRGLQQAILACRSERAKLPSGDVIPLKKFASMGSALTFPLESMVFYTVIHLAWKACYGKVHSALTPNDGVRVYGDDMVVPVEMVPFLIKELETFGLKVNATKSFWTGFFRESCGEDYYAGFPVKTVKLGGVLPYKGRLDLVVKAIEFHNNLFNAGYFGTARYVKHLVLKDSGLRTHIPSIPPSHTGLGFFSNDESEWKTRVNPNLQKLEYRVLVKRTSKPTDPLLDYGALRKFFNPHDLRELDHLRRDGRSQLVGLTTGWA